jgi:SAM-dependent methyltransferase
MNGETTYLTGNAVKEGLTDIRKLEASEFIRASASSPYVRDDDAVGKLTIEAIEKAGPVMQTHKFSPDDREHVVRLLSMFSPPANARVLDAGCGVGIVAALMHTARPDLEFVLLNVSPAQLAMCPPDMERIAADFHEIPLPSESADAVMVNYALGYALLEKVFEEFSRVLRPGGVLFIYDLAADDSDLVTEHLGYRAHSTTRVMQEAALHSFTADGAQPAGGSHVEHFYKLMPRGTFAELFHGVRPVAYRFTRSVKGGSQHD